MKQLVYCDQLNCGMSERCDAGRAYLQELEDDLIWICRRETNIYIDSAPTDLPFILQNIRLDKTSLLGVRMICEGWGEIHYDVQANCTVRST